MALTRRSFLGAGAAAAATLAVTGVTGCSSEEPAGRSGERAEDRFVWNSCAVDCPHWCALRIATDGEKVGYVFTDDTDSDEFGQYQLRACPRGRATRWILESEDRLDAPLKRTGARGSGEFEPISWDEALSAVADGIRTTIDQYGNEGLFLLDHAGDRTPTKDVWRRLLNTVGGYSALADERDNAAAAAVAPLMFGMSDVEAASSLGEMERSDLVVLFGNDPATAGPSGASAAYDYNVAQASRRPRTILIDPRWSQTATHVDEWIPIRPGTDGALVQGIAYVLITEELVDEEFLSTHVSGYDGPAGYRAYVLGEEPYTPPKTPEWAAAWTGIPADRIVKLARELAAANAPFISQGWALARRNNGEQTVRAICTLPVLLGKLGQPGTNPGLRERRGARQVIAPIPAGENPVTDSIAYGAWADALGDPIRGIIAYRSDHLTTLSGDIRRKQELLRDEERVPFIVAMDTRMTDSCLYADIVLPDLYPAERSNLDCTDPADGVMAVIGGLPAYDTPKGERRHAYEVCAALAQQLGTADRFTEGAATLDDWQERLYQQALTESGMNDLPADLAALQEQGIWKRRVPTTVGLEAFRQDAAGAPLATPSGRIELNIDRLGTIADGDFRVAARALPEYATDSEGFNSRRTDVFDLQLIGFGAVNHAGSEFAGISKMEEVFKDRVWMNPITAAKAGGITDGETIIIHNDRGSIRARVKLTPRIMPRVLALPVGNAPHTGDGEDEGLRPAFNMLTSDRPSPVAGGSTVNSVNVGIRRIGVPGEVR